MIKKVQGGWFCSLTGHIYDSEEAARHYDEIYARQLQARASRKSDPDLERIVTRLGYCQAGDRLIGGAD